MGSPWYEGLPSVVAKKPVYGTGLAKMTMTPPGPSNQPAELHLGHDELDALEGRQLTLLHQRIKHILLV